MDYNNKRFDEIVNNINYLLRDQSLSASDRNMLILQRNSIYEISRKKTIVSYRKESFSWMLKQLNKKMKSEIKKIGIKNLYYFSFIIENIINKKEDYQVAFEKSIDSKDVINHVISFYKEVDIESYNIINSILKYPKKIYNISNDPKTIDSCIFKRFYKYPVVNIKNTNNYEMCVKLVHEMQHQVSYVINERIGYNYKKINHLLVECTPMFFELLYCDYLNKQGLNNSDVMSLYKRRQKSIDESVSRAKLYIDLLCKYCDKVTPLTISDLENFYSLSNDRLFTNLSYLLGYDILSDMKYILSYLKSVEINSVYTFDKKEAMGIIKYINRLELYDYDFSKINKQGIIIGKFPVQSDYYNKHIQKILNK
jgi:hypothetical protein